MRISTQNNEEPIWDAFYFLGRESQKIPGLEDDLENHQISSHAQSCFNVNQIFYNY